MMKDACGAQPVRAFLVCRDFGDPEMKAAEFWKVITVDEANLLERVLRLLEDNEIRYCVIGGQAVNAYAEPVVSLDLDLVIAVDQLGFAEGILTDSLEVRRFPHSLNVSAPGSDLRVQVQTDPRYADFPERAAQREVLGRPMAVAALEDVLKGKVWAALDPERRSSKRQKDLADIARIIEQHPRLKAKVPQEILARLQWE